MNMYLSLRTAMSLSLPAVAMVLSGCAPGAHRNVVEAVVVTATPSLVEAGVRFGLELRDSRQEVALSEVTAFLASDEASRLRRNIKAELRRKQRKLQETLSKAKEQSPEEVILARPDADRPYSDSNLVLYLKGQPNFHVYFSSAEIDQILAYRKLTDDLDAIEYSHPLFESRILGALVARLGASGIDVKNAAMSKAEHERLKTLAASGILEQKLRELGAKFTGDLPVLTTDFFGRTRSPKLAQALQDRVLFEQIIRCNDPNVIRALVYLVDSDVVKLAHR